LAFLPRAVTYCMVGNKSLHLVQRLLHLDSSIENSADCALIDTLSVEKMWLLVSGKEKMESVLNCKLKSVFLTLVELVLGCSK
jgi:hypothetical protein